MVDYQEIAGAQLHTIHFFFIFHLSIRALLTPRLTFFYSRAQRDLPVQPRTTALIRSQRKTSSFLQKIFSTYLAFILSPSSVIRNCYVNLVRKSLLRQWKDGVFHVTKYLGVLRQYDNFAYKYQSQNFITQLYVQKKSVFIYQYVLSDVLKDLLLK